MKWMLIVAAVLVAVPLILWIIGSFLPREHVASRTLRLSRPIGDVWAVVSDYARHGEWQSGFKRVERLPDRDGKPLYKLDGGRMAMTIELTELSPPSRMVTTIADDALPFGGTWTWALTPDAAGGGCAVTITERGFVKPALFRAIGRYFIGYDATIRATLRDLAKKFGETPRIE